MTDFLEDKFREPYERFRRAPLPEHAEALLAAVKPILDTAVKAYAPSGSPVLFSRAKLLALKAFQSYDPSKAKLRSHLLTNLQPLRQAAAAEGQAVTLPEKAALHRSRLHRAQTELLDELGREPSTAELADRSGLSIRRIAKLQRAGSAYAEGQLNNPFIEAAGAAEPGVSRNDQLWHDFVYHGLEPTDQAIMEFTLGLHGRPQLTKTAIARKLRLSPGAVSQRAARIQQRLNEHEQPDALF